MLPEEKNEVNIQQPLCCHAHAYNTQYKQNGLAVPFSDMTIDKCPGHYFMTSKPRVWVPCTHSPRDQLRTCGFDGLLHWTIALRHLLLLAVLLPTFWPFYGHPSAWKRLYNVLIYLCVFHGFCLVILHAPSWPYHS